MDVFADKVALVTGGASGIGRALCAELVRRGAQVGVVDRDAAGAAAVAGGIGAAAGQAWSVAVDVTDPAAVEALVETTVRTRGRIDYIFNNAGIAVLGEELDVTLADWRRVVDVDLFGVVHGIRAAYPRMVRQGFGHIVNTASLAGLTPAAMELSYTAAKYAVVGLSRGLRAEAAAHGVKVSVVCPGFIATPILHNTEMRRPVDRGKLLALMPPPLPPDRCARAILRGVARNRGIIMVTAHARLIWFIERLCPAAMDRFWLRHVLRIRALHEPRPEHDNGPGPLLK